MDTTKKPERVKWRQSEVSERIILTVGPNSRFVMDCVSLDLARQIVHEHNTWGELLEAAQFFFTAVEEGTLVRDVRHDAAPDWAAKMLQFTVRLSKAKTAIAAAEKEEG